MHWDLALAAAFFHLIFVPIRCSAAFLCFQGYRNLASANLLSFQISDLFGRFLKPQRMCTCCPKGPILSESDIVRRVNARCEANTCFIAR
jgi:hypothetical protein